MKRYFKGARNTVFGKLKTVQGTRQRRFTYSEYINSNLWSARRNRYFQEHGRRCGACGSGARIHLHHIIYTAFDGTEPDKNLIPLCEKHHAMYHERHGSQGNMKITTEQFLDEIRQARVN